MNSWSLKQKTLAAIAPALVLSQIVIFQFLVHFFGDTWGYLLGYVVYWLIWCIPVSLIFLKKNLLRLCRLPKGIYNKTHWISASLVALPALATGLAVFPRYAPSAGWEVVLLALFFAMINAPIEELFWRGVFPSVFPKSFWLGFLYPTFCFGAWHLAPALAKESGMDGGILGFVGGAYFMGLVWGWYSHRYKTILPSTVSHVLTNLFAFTGFLYVNWFASSHI
ncbi:CPBP family intramembrane metalloprotease [Brevibacillus sp. SYP-B805]|uniref:CPBP family intramembrane glutamic endopeptidase n=1 Tax=Brevibacillus sp. SYP-B805 TaxID=1578199 RepID=UPI0013EB0491|nr:CPBP family intramembrane glutamic endopeptidase [Brevibacillus sp. SYP-B805]NGQ94940.1 CPBP family intramembrane metalloprotease [Brevibacillus sp. SYP-B805]